MDYVNVTPPTEAPKVSAIAMRYGLLLGLASIAISLVLFLTNLDQSGLRWITLPVAAGFIYMAHTQFKRLNGGYMEYGQGLGIGTLMNVVSGLMSSVFFYLYVTVIDTGYMQKMLDTARAQMEAKGNMSDADIDRAMEMTGKFMNPGVMVAFGIIGAVFFGFVLSLIISAITKNSQPEFE